MPETEMRALQQLGQVEYQQFAVWYKAYYNRDAPPNDVKLVNNDVYKFWRQNIAPATWSSEMEMEATKEWYQKTPEEEAAFTRWYKGVYGEAPTEKASEPGSIWHQAFRGLTSLPPEGLAEDTPGELLDPFAMTKYQTWQAGQAEKEFAWQQQQARDKASWESTQQLREYDMSRWRRDAAIAQWETDRLRNRLGGDSGFAQEQAMQKEMAKQFEQQRQALISSISPSSRDWIGMWRAQTQVNPFGERERTPDEELAKLQLDKKDIDETYKAAIDLEKRAASDPDRSLKADERQIIDIVKAAKDDISHKLLNVQLARNAGKWGLPMPSGANEEQYQAGGWSVPRGDPATGYEVGKPDSGKVAPASMPNIPAWLQAASGIKGRVPETRTDILRPSAQSWRRLDPSQQGMFEGLVDWAGNIPFEDIKAQMARETPQKRLGSQWTPIRQV